MGWFEKELNYARDHYDDDLDLAPATPSRSLTGRLWEYMGSSNWTSWKEDPDAEGRDNIKREVAGTVNLLNNSRDGKEKSLKLGFANAERRVNTLASDEIIMPADIVDTTGSVESAIDVMSGMALMAATMKATTHLDDYVSATLHKETHGGRYLWEALEQAIARKKVLDKWPGFSSYFDSHRDYSSKVDGEQVRGLCELDVMKGIEGGISKKTALIIAAYNTLNPKGAECMDDERIAKVMNMIAELALDDGKGRFAMCCNIVEFIRETFPPDPDDKPCDGDGEEDGHEDGDEDTTDGDDESGEGEGDEEGEDDGDEDGEGGKSDEDGESDGEDGEDGESDKTGDEGEDESSEGEGEAEGESEFGELPQQTDKDLFGGDMAEARDEGEPRDISDLILPSISTRGCASPEYICVEEPKGDYRDIRYKRMVERLGGKIKQVTNSLDFLNNNADSEVHGMLNGHLDTGALHKLANEDIENPTVFSQTENVTSKKIAVTLLVDQSGSMGCGTRMESANDVAAIMIESLDKIDGIALNVSYHTAYSSKYSENTVATGFDKGECGYSENLWIQDVITDQKDSRMMVADMTSGSQNLDGFAIKFIAERMSDNYSDYDEKIMFVLSDGVPAARGYTGYPANRHTSDCCNYSRQFYGVQVYGIGIDNAFDNDTGKTLYGEGNFIVLPNVKDSVRVMTSFLRKVATKNG